MTVLRLCRAAVPYCTVISPILSLFLLGMATAASAHDFWLQSDHPQASPGEPIKLTFQVGHGTSRQRSKIPDRRIIRFQAIDSDGRRIDMRRQLHVGAESGDATVTFAKPGTYSIVLETDNRAESHLSASRFNDYLKDEGLSPAISLRRSTGRENADGAENYSRHARTIIQVGPIGPRGQVQLTRPAGLALEIIPEASPQLMARTGTLPVRIFYRGKPLAGALVKLNDVDHDAQPIAMHRSDAKGRAVFAIPGSGSWQLNVVWTRPQPSTSLTDFDTSFSSLSFAMVDWNGHVSHKAIGSFNE